MALLEGLSREVVTETLAWYKTARAANWQKLDDVRKNYPSADQAGNVLIFDIRHNRYRLITRVSFPKQRLYVKTLLTHKEYDREEWKKWM
jgi:mRNA interferase HigB